MTNAVGHNLYKIRFDDGSEQVGNVRTMRPKNPTANPISNNEENYPEAVNAKDTEEEVYIPYGAQREGFG